MILTINIRRDHIEDVIKAQGYDKLGVTVEMILDAAKVFGAENGQRKGRVNARLLVDGFMYHFEHSIEESKKSGD